MASIFDVLEVVAASTEVVLLEERSTYYVPADERRAINAALERDYNEAARLRAVAGPVAERVPRSPTRPGSLGNTSQEKHVSVQRRRDVNAALRAVKEEVAALKELGAVGQSSTTTANPLPLPAKIELAPAASTSGPEIPPSEFKLTAASPYMTPPASPDRPATHAKTASAQPRTPITPRTLAWVHVPPTDGTNFAYARRLIDDPLLRAPSSCKAIAQYNRVVQQLLLAGSIVNCIDAETRSNSGVSVRTKMKAFDNVVEAFASRMFSEEQLTNLTDNVFEAMAKVSRNAHRIDSSERTAEAIMDAAFIEVIDALNEHGGKRGQFAIDRQSVVNGGNPRSRVDAALFRNGKPVCILEAKSYKGTGWVRRADPVHMVGYLPERGQLMLYMLRENVHFGILSSVEHWQFVIAHGAKGEVVDVFNDASLPLLSADGGRILRRHKATWREPLSAIVQRLIFFACGGQGVDRSAKPDVDSTDSSDAESEGDAEAGSLDGLGALGDEFSNDKDA